MTRWTVVPQNVTRTPQISYMVPMDAGAAASQIYNMQNRNNLTMNEQIIVDKADNALYRAEAAENATNDLGKKLAALIKNEALIYGSIGIIIIAVILVYRSVM